MFIAIDCVDLCLSHNTVYSRTQSLILTDFVLDALPYLVLGSLVHGSSPLASLLHMIPCTLLGGLASTILYQIYPLPLASGQYPSRYRYIRALLTEIDLTPGCQALHVRSSPRWSWCIRCHHIEALALVDVVSLSITLSTPSQVRYDRTHWHTTGTLAEVKHTLVWTVSSYI